MAQDNARAIFILPFLINLCLIFSVSSLNDLINQNITEEGIFPLPTWMFYLTATVLGPCIIAIIKILPDPSYALFVGCSMTSIGLLWTGLVSDVSQLFTFGCLASLGICVSFVASCIYLAPLFVGPNRSLPLGLIMIGSALMMIQHTVMTSSLFHMKWETFFILSLAVFITSIIPAIFLFMNRKSDQQHDDGECTSVCSSDGEEDHKTDGRTVHCAFLNVLRKSFSSDSWLLSIPAVIVWIMWGSAVDTTWLSLLMLPGTNSTWLSMGWITQHDHQLNLIILQLFFSLLVCLVKLYTELSVPSKRSFTPTYRIIFSSNYMHLGLLGAAGLVYCFFSKLMDPLHNHLLFSFTFALQFDDLSDLDIKKNTSRIWLNFISHSYPRKKEKSSLRKNVFDGITVLCHLFCLCAMSSMAIFLGLQIANFAGVCLKSIEYLPIFSSYGLGLLSVISIGFSLSQPDIWLRRKSNDCFLIQTLEENGKNLNFVKI